MSLRFDAYIVDIYPFRWPRNILSIHLSIISLYFIIYVFMGNFNIYTIINDINFEIIADLRIIFIIIIILIILFFIIIFLYVVVFIFIIAIIEIIFLFLLVFFFLFLFL